MRAALKHNFFIQSGLANMRNILCAIHKNMGGRGNAILCLICSFSVVIELKGCPRERETRPLKGRLGISHREAFPFTRIGPLTGRPGLTYGSRASNREARSLTGRPGLSLGCQTCHRETHKVSPKSTDPVYLYSLYSYLQNVNTVLLDSRLGQQQQCL